MIAHRDSDRQGCGTGRNRQSMPIRGMFVGLPKQYSTLNQTKNAKPDDRTWHFS
jgi:hypothetical protein